MKHSIFSTRIIAVLLYIILGLLCYKPQVNSAQSNFNIVLITIDTLRADHLSCYGYERKTSPKQYETNVNHVIPDELTTLAEILKIHGYTTFGVSSNLLLDEKTGFAIGFDYFEHRDGGTANSINKIAYSFEDEIKNSDKFFLWVHYMDPHLPYRPRNPWVEQYTSKSLTAKLNLFKKSYKELMRFAPKLKKDPQALTNLIALYDSEINFVDFYIGELIQKLSLDKDTLIIVTSDHGEEFLEHKYLTHGNNLYKETIHIPLIVKLPNSAKKETVTKYVNLVDIMPAILQLLEINPPEQVLGKSFFEKKGLLSLFNKILFAKDTSDCTFSEISKENILKTIMTPEYKYIYDYKRRKGLLYDMKVDPLERKNIINRKTNQSIQLKARLTNWASNLKKYSSEGHLFPLAPEEKEKLEALGYLGKQVKKKLPLRVTVDEGEAVIKKIDRSDNTIEIELTNNFPVRIVQFIIKGIEVAEVRSTTRTERFQVKYNKEDDKFTILSFSDEVIAPGTGSIAEIVCDKKSSASLSGINIFK